MKKILSLPVLLGFMLMGCSTASTTILPQGNNCFSAVAISYSQSDALEEGMKKAHEICQNSGKILKVLDTKTKYTGGVDQNVKQAISAVSLATGSYVSPHDKDDYTVTIKFKCIN
ncbi:MAG TPA: hypothetical protein PKD00_09465 [Burkholderiales bacterium]|nr:hypothetical protein [Burkholderiales bacterium]